jgi:hypothetical protein
MEQHVYLSQNNVSKWSHVALTHYSDSDIHVAPLRHIILTQIYMLLRHIILTQIYMLLRHIILTQIYMLLRHIILTRSLHLLSLYTDE